MKSLKKTLVLLVVFSMILSAVMPAFAATDVYGLDCEEEVARLEALKVVSGYEDGTYGPEKTITRAEMAVILCKMVGIDTVTVEENKNVPSKFSDVAAGEWYTGHINVAAGKGLLSGFPDGTFRPSEQLTMNQVLTLCVNALGRGEYVAEMGTWPANYIAEATKLGLLDGVKTSDANRGNVAIIVWNTIEAPYVWDVTGTEFTDSSINLSNSERSLLSIYFRDYADKKGELKELTEVQITDAKIDDRQLKLTLTEAQVANFDFKSEPRKNADEKSYKTSTTNVVVYVPEEVVADLDELEDKYVTIILGEDNIAVAVIVEEEATAKDFLTAYDAAKERITVGGTRYDLAKDVDKTGANNVPDGTDDAYGYTVELNGVPCDGVYGTATPVTPIAEALAAITFINAADYEDIEKKIQAEITLNEDDEVEAIELFVSTSVLANTTEVIVTDINETSKKYEIETTAGDIKWDLEDEEDLKFPKVYTNGARSDIKDIEVGNVLTIITGAATASDVDFKGNTIAKIYVGTETVTGEATKVKKANNAITLDGTVYLATDADSVTMTTDEIEDNNFGTFKSTTILDNEEVTLYLNVMGEYVAVSVAEDVSDYQFGIVTKIYTTEGLEEIDGDEYAQRSIKVLLADGEEVRFTVQTNDDDKDTPDEKALDDLLTATNATIEVGDFVMFEADSNNVITLEDGDELMLAKTYDDYVVSTIDVTKAVAGKKFTTNGGEYAYTSNTVVFNSHTGTTSTADNDDDIREVVSNWNSILEYKAAGAVATDSPAGDYFKSANTAVAVVKEDSTKALYVVVDSTYSSSDYELAVVTRKLDEVKEDKYEIDFAHQTDVEVDNNPTVITALTNVIDWLVKYTTKNGKVDAATKLIDMDAIADADSDDLINGIFADDSELDLHAKFAPGVNFAQLEVSEIYIDGDDYADITFSAGENKVVVNEAAAFKANSSKYYVEDSTAADGYKVAGTTYDETATYYEKVYTQVDTSKVQTPDANTKYYKEGSSAGTYDVIADNSTISDWTTTKYYTMAYVKVDLKDIDMKLGTIKLDAEELKVYDLRDGDVKEITLTSEENPGFSAVVYKEKGASEEGNVIFIID